MRVAYVRELGCPVNMWQSRDVRCRLSYLTADVEENVLKLVCHNLSLCSLLHVIQWLHFFCSILLPLVFASFVFFYRFIYCVLLRFAIVGSFMHLMCFFILLFCLLCFCACYNKFARCY